MGLKVRPGGKLALLVQTVGTKGHGGDHGWSRGQRAPGYGGDMGLTCTGLLWSWGSLTIRGDRDTSEGKWPPPAPVWTGATRTAMGCPCK